MHTQASESDSPASHDGTPAQNVARLGNVLWHRPRVPAASLRRARDSSHRALCRYLLSSASARASVVLTVADEDATELRPVPGSGWKPLRTIYSASIHCRNALPRSRHGAQVLVSWSHRHSAIARVFPMPRATCARGTRGDEELGKLHSQRKPLGAASRRRSFSDAYAARKTTCWGAASHRQLVNSRSRRRRVHGLLIPRAQMRRPDDARVHHAMLTALAFVTGNVYVTEYCVDRPLRCKLRRGLRSATRRAGSDGSSSASAELLSQ